MKYAENLISSGNTSELLENIVQRFREDTKESDVIIVEGLVPTDKHQFANSINYSIAKALSADMVFVAHPSNDSSQQLKERIDIAVSTFGGKDNKRIAGCIINKVGAPVDENDNSGPDLTEMFDIPVANCNSNLEVLQMFSKSPLPILGCIPWSADLIAPRVKDLAVT